MDRLTNEVPKNERIQELCDGYALGVLEGEELQEMRALLAQRESPLREEVGRAMRRSEETAAWLAWGTPPVAPPEGLRQRLLEQVEAEGGHRRTNVVAFAEGRPRTKLAWLGWAAAAALAIAAGWLGGRASRAEEQLAEARQVAATLQTSLAERERVLRIIAARDSRAIRLASTAPEAPQFRAYWSESAGLVLTGSNVTAPAAGRTMQLWLVPKQGNPISAGVFTPSGAGEVLLIASNAVASLPGPDAVQALAISDEPAGGSAQPTTAPAWVGAVGGF